MSGWRCERCGEDFETCQCGLVSISEGIRMTTLYRIVDAQGTIRLNTDKEPRTEREARILSDISYQMWAHDHPHEYPFILIAVTQAS